MGYLTTPLIASNMTYAEKSIEKACGCTAGTCTCTEASCGCPVYVAFHFYAFDCRPEEPGGSGYATFQERLDSVASIMDKYPFVKGAIINEVGMLNCEPGEPICVPNGPKQKYPAASQPNHDCPATEALPHGLASFVEKVVDMAVGARTKDGRMVVKAQHGR